MIDPLTSTQGRRWLLNNLFETAPADIERSCNIQLLNLLCADVLPGNENIDIRGCLKRLDDLTEYIKGSIDRTYRAHGPSSDYHYSKNQTHMSCLVTRIKREFGAGYSPKARADLEAGVDAPFDDASEVFINGLLHPDRHRRWGTCSSIPVLVTAIARKLGYPVHLAAALQHRYCRWENDEGAFNIEASNPMGMAVLPDEHYRQLGGGFRPEDVTTDFYFRAQTPAEEFAGFMKNRISVLRDAKRYGEILLWAARALQFAPDDWVFPRVAYHLSHLALQQRCRLRYPGKDVAFVNGAEPDYGDIGLLVAPYEHALMMAIWGHYREHIGELDNARFAFEAACRQNFEGNNEQRDLQRFLKKYSLPRRKGPLLPVINPGIPPRFIVKCRPEDQAEQLGRIADEFERKEGLVQARDALHDLYMLDPSNAEVFQRARAIEGRPLFQKQFGILFEERRRKLQAEGRLPKGVAQPAPAATKPTVPVNPFNVIKIKGPLNIVNFSRGRLAN